MRRRRACSEPAEASAASELALTVTAMKSRSPGACTCDCLRAGCPPPRNSIPSRCADRPEATARAASGVDPSGPVRDRIGDVSAPSCLSPYSLRGGVVSARGAHPAPGRSPPGAGRIHSRSPGTTPRETAAPPSAHIRRRHAQLRRGAAAGRGRRQPPTCRRGARPLRAPRRRRRPRR